MLFNSIEFLVFFLPVVLAGHLILLRLGVSTLGWLLAASLVFYGWWEPRYLFLLLGSAAANFLLARCLHRVRGNRGQGLILLAGVVFNLGLLAFYKYAAFIIDNLAALLGVSWQAPDILLPLAISFFTFQQIAYLADVNKGLEAERSPLRYLLFVSFFPQLIAGPIVHHRQLLPQLNQLDSLFNRGNLAPAISLIILGLAKKVLLADSLALFADPGFALAASGGSLHGAEATLSLTAYTLQIYFDFSGYCDIALGAALLFGVRLPVNFFSPYQAGSVIEIWKRWHITLSQFLRDYLYIPLGGNRLGRWRQYINLAITMLLGGLWHGASWNFVIWGGLHGIFLVINHLWRALLNNLSWQPRGMVWSLLCQLLTVSAFAAAFAYFRAPTTAAANRVLTTIFTQPGDGFGAAYLDALGNSLSGDVLASIAEPLGVAPLASLTVMFALAIALLMPNALQLVNGQRRGFELPDVPERAPLGRLHWRPTVGWGIALGVILWGVGISLTAVSPFLYFQF